LYYDPMILATKILATKNPAPKGRVKWGVSSSEVNPKTMTNKARWHPCVKYKTVFTFFLYVFLAHPKEVLPMDTYYI
jgi:hypothetical protein